MSSVPGLPSSRDMYYVLPSKGQSSYSRLSERPSQYWIPLDVVVIVEYKGIFFSIS